MSGDVNPFASPSTEAAATAGRKRHPFIKVFRPGRTFAIVATVFFGLTVIARMLRVGSTWLQIGLLEAAINGNLPTEQAVIENDLRQARVQMLVLAVMCGSAISFIAWFYRVSSNLRPLGIASQSYSPGWTIGAWFIPIGNLVIPYQVMAEVWNGSSPAISASRFVLRAPGLMLVRVWWGMYLVSNIFATIGNVVFVGMDLHGLIQESWWLIFTDCLSLVAVVLAVLIVWRIDANQAARNEAVAELAARSPPITFNSGTQGSRPRTVDEPLLPWHDQKE